MIDPLDVIEGASLQQLLETLQNSLLHPREVEKYGKTKRKDFPQGLCLHMYISIVTWTDLRMLSQACRRVAPTLSASGCCAKTRLPGVMSTWTLTASSAGVNSATNYGICTNWASYGASRTPRSSPLQRISMLSWDCSCLVLTSGFCTACLRSAQRYDQQVNQRCNAIFTFSTFGA